MTLDCRDNVPTVLAMNLADAKHALDHGTDGPITAFVLISRATTLAAAHPAHAEVVANALYECLTEYSWLRAEDDVVVPARWGGEESWS